MTPVAMAEEARFTPSELLVAYSQWHNQQVTIEAYPALFMSPARWQAKHMEFGATPQPQTPTLAVCDTLNPPGNDRIRSTDVVILRATVLRRQVAPSQDTPHRIRLSECEVLSVEAQPSQHPDAIPLDTLHRAMFDLIGQTVRVSGFYWGKTWSEASDLTRHDLQDTAEFLGPKPVACFQQGNVEAPQFVLDNRADAQNEGRVDLTAFSRADRVDLTDCRFVRAE
ncbi:hypothetical protein MWU54_11690 [Marivita sp. S6314]|uniref:hypothetical protein n=1 Tax=Marivita sp. S6314 TaxID=2926406 RepID=UPI001FF40279|nr:hypothetical protein [Marivita sp. S6314]MCK0150690.1 hypothetical protein [Marivita sp. S6314]